MRRDEGTSELVALVWLTPIVLIALGVVTYAGRVSAAKLGVFHAVDAGAQSAALVRDGAAAPDAARQAVAEVLSLDGRSCEGGPEVLTDTSDWRAGGRVSVRVTCRIRRSDLFGFAAPGSVSVTASSAAVIDTYRGLP